MRSDLISWSISTKGTVEAQICFWCKMRLIKGLPSLEDSLEKIVWRPRLIGREDLLVINHWYLIIHIMLVYLAWKNKLLDWLVANPDKSSKWYKVDFMKKSDEDQ